MGQRDTISFIVPVGRPAPGEKQSYLSTDPDWKLTELDDEAIRFRMYVTPLLAEQIAIEQASHDIAGGLHAFLDLEEGVRVTYEALVMRLENDLWPEGKPDAETPDQIGELQEQLEDAFQADESRQKAGLSRMRAMVERIGFLAAWEHLVIDPPEGWNNLKDKPLPPSILGWIQNAHTGAIAEFVAGKP